MEHYENTFKNDIRSGKLSHTTLERHLNGMMDAVRNEVLARTARLIQQEAEEQAQEGKKNGSAPPAHEKPESMR